MSASKDTKRGTWKVYIRYKDWKGVGQVHTKCGFATKREALEYEREFLLKKSKNINMGFNYSNENPGAPWSNIALMMLVCAAMGNYIFICNLEDWKLYVCSNNAWCGKYNRRNSSILFCIIEKRVAWS